MSEYNLEKELERRLAEERAIEARAAEDRKQAAKFKEAETFDKLNRVFSNADYQWFVETYLAPLLAREHDAALDISRGPAERNDRAQRHAQAKEMMLLLSAELQRLQNSLLSKA